MAVCLALTTIAPSYAQSAPTLGSWQAGPDAKGTNTYVGRIEAPRAGQNVTAGANLLVSGWAVDTTAAGWAGFDGVEVWRGAKDKGGTKLATGTVGLSRPDIADALGAAYRNSGFSATVPPMTDASGSQTLFVYLHTPDKGTWYKSVSVSVPAAAPTGTSPNLILSFIRPQENAVVTTKQVTQFYTIRGIALDSTPITDPGNQTLGPCQCGISNVTVYLDAPRGQALPQNVFTANLGALYGVNNTTRAAGKTVASFSPVAREFGGAFDFAQWNVPINPATFAPGYHTLYAYATSSITKMRPWSRGP